MANKFLILMFIGFQFVNLPAQKINQRLYVLTKDDLILREGPNANTKVLGKLVSGDMVTVKTIEQLDTIEMRIANWVQVKTRNEKEGYVFSGYLNSRPKPDEKILQGFWSISEILNYLTDKYSPMGIVSYSKLFSGVKDQYEINLFDNADITIYERSGFEWGETEYILKNWRLHELINLIYYCDWFGNNYEYENLKNSFSEDDYSFMYLTGHSDPEREVIIEQGKNNVRILIRDSL